MIPISIMNLTTFRHPSGPRAIAFLLLFGVSFVSFCPAVLCSFSAVPFSLWAFLVVACFLGAGSVLWRGDFLS